MFPWIARALKETSFIALLTGYIAAYWFATDPARRLPATQKTRSAMVDADSNRRQKEA
jgi:hypothetical protein